MSTSKLSTKLITSQDIIIILVARFLTISEYGKTLAPVSFQFANINYENYCTGIEKYIYEKHNYGSPNVALYGFYTSIYNKSGINVKGVSFHPNNKIYSITYISNGLPAGRQRLWHENGSPHYTTYYKDGKVTKTYTHEWKDITGEFTCPHILLSGPRIGTKCGKYTTGGWKICKNHKLTQPKPKIKLKLKLKLKQLL